MGIFIILVVLIIGGAVAPAIEQAVKQNSSCNAGNNNCQGID